MTKSLRNIAIRTHHRFKCFAGCTTQHDQVSGVVDLLSIRPPESLCGATVTASRLAPLAMGAMGAGSLQRLLQGHIRAP